MYAKLENDKWIEVRGNGVPEATLRKLGFVRLIKTQDIPLDNQEIIIEQVGEECREVIITREYYVKFGTNDPVAISNKARDFLEANFADAKVVDAVGRVRKIRWRLGNPELKRMRRLVWEKWSQYIGDFIASRVTSGDDNEDDGVSFNDLILHSFFTGDWPIQSRNGKTKLGATAINRIKGEIREALILKREAVELACIPIEPTVAAWTLAVENSAKWVMDGQV